MCAVDNTGDGSLQGTGELSCPQQTSGSEDEEDMLSDLIGNLQFKKVKKELLERAQNQGPD